MSVKRPEDVYGYEYDWLACDQVGQVALLSTAGGGFAPPAFLADTDAYDQAIEAIHRLSETTAAKIAPFVKNGLPNTWRDMAARGLFAFDADPLGGPYRLVAVPVRPIVVGELPQEIADVARKIELKTVRFTVVTQIVREDILMNQGG